MDLETKFKKETGSDAYADNDLRPKVPSDYYVEWLEEQLTLTDVVSSFNLEIKDRDIATIEALHDTLLDKKVLGLNARSMKESRALTQRMYKALSKD